jgi:hypothetical protein
MREMKLSAIRRYIMVIRCQIIAIHQLQLRYLSETIEIMYNGQITASMLQIETHKSFAVLFPVSAASSYCI